MPKNTQGQAKTVDYWGYLFGYGAEDHTEEQPTYSARQNHTPQQQDTLPLFSYRSYSPFEVETQTLAPAQRIDISRYLQDLIEDREEDTLSVSSYSSDSDFTDTDSDYTDSDWEDEYYELEEPVTSSDHILTVRSPALRDELLWLDQQRIAEAEHYKAEALDSIHHSAKEWLGLKASVFALDKKYQAEKQHAYDQTGYVKRVVFWKSPTVSDARKALIEQIKQVVRAVDSMVDNGHGLSEYTSTNLQLEATLLKNKQAMMIVDGKILEVFEKVQSEYALTSAENSSLYAILKPFVDEMSQDYQADAKAAYEHFATPSDKAPLKALDPKALVESYKAKKPYAFTIDMTEPKPQELQTFSRSEGDSSYREKRSYAFVVEMGQRHKMQRDRLTEEDSTESYQHKLPISFRA